MTTVALLGNPNVGKTTLFNAMTGSKQHIGNWPGVTVEKKEGFYNNVKIVDLPGIYAMDTFSHEEKIAKNFLEDEDVDIILNIVDGSNLARNLYLTTQLKQFNKPIILAINMIDVVESKGLEIDYDKLSKDLNVTVIPIKAAKGQGVDKLKETIEKNNFTHIKDSNKFDFKDEKSAYKYIDKYYIIA